MRVELLKTTPDIENHIVEIARVSSSREDKLAEADRLIGYLIRNHHWSPFEHGYLTFEIETSKAIAIQILRHRSFTFQELSQRYANVSSHYDGDMFEDVEIRKQAENNRQSSTEVFDPEILFAGQLAPGDYPASEVIEELLNEIKGVYKDMLQAGVARECARMILPMCTKTTLHMTGNVRSWIHFLALRDEEHAQKEIQLIAKAIKEIFVDELPMVSKALGYE